MATPIKTMRDSNGQEVPVKYVSAYDKLRDKITRRIKARFLKARAALEAVVSESIADLDELILLDERVVRARELMLGYVEGVLAKIGGNDAQALKLIVAEAFKANAQGFLSTGKIMSLLRMEIDNADWRKAKQILQDAIKPQKGKRYLACEVRRSTQEDFRQIRLDIADCWPSEN